MRSEEQEVSLESEIFERFFVQTMPSHLSVQRFVIDLGLLRCRRNAALVLNEKAAQVFFFTA